MKPTHGLRIVLLAAPVSFLGACSSGSGGIPAVPTDPAAITEENASQVAAGMSMTATVIDFQETMGFETLTEEGTGTFEGDYGGSVTAGFEIDAAPVGEVSTGDRFAVSFDNFVMDVDGASINGGIVIDFDTITGDWTVDDQWEVDLGFEVNGLSFSSGPATGYFDASWDQNAGYDMGDKDFSLAGDFTTSVNDGSGWKSAALDDLDLNWVYDAVAGEATYYVNGRFASTMLGGSVTVTTNSPFVIRDDDEFPYTGSMEAEGAGGCTLTLTVLDETSVRLEVDVDGDGDIDATMDLDWFDLELE